MKAWFIPSYGGPDVLQCGDWPEPLVGPQDVLVALTSLQAMVDIAHIQPRQKVLIHAGAGGVGTFAIQLAKHLGAYVCATASQAKHPLLRSLGADEVIDYKTQDFAQILSGYDMVLDTQGGDTLLRSFGVLRAGGIVVSVAGPPDLELARTWPMPWYLRLGIRAISWKVRRVARSLQCRYRFMLMQPSGAQLAEIAAPVDGGIIRPVIDKVYAFDQVKQAVAYAETGRATGKVVIRVDALGGSADTPHSALAA